jgi:hypothetical protein
MPAAPVQPAAAAAGSKPGLPWRRWNAATHRDIGYLSVALTLVYGISGIAVNHIHQWNPNYAKSKRVEQIRPLPKEESTDRLTQAAQEQLQPPGTFKSAFQPDDDTLQLFYKEATYSVDLPTGKVLVETTQPRPVLFALNQLHLNTPKRLWTWVADLYAAALIALACTGMFILKGREGITGRGAWLVGLGTAIPTVYWTWFVFLR